MKNIVIRPITIEDTNKIIKWRNSPDVIKNFIIRNKLTKKQHIDWFNNKVKKGEVVQFIAVDTINNKEFATTYLKNIDYINKKAEYGTFIGDPEYRGKNNGQTITKLTLDYAFNKLYLNKVYSRILSNNKPSYYMCKKVGFKKDAVLRKDIKANNHYEDVYIVSILKSEFKK